MRTSIYLFKNPTIKGWNSNFHETSKESPTTEVKYRTCKYLFRSPATKGHTCHIKELFLGHEKVLIGHILCKAECSSTAGNNSHLQQWLCVFQKPSYYGMPWFMICYSLAFKFAYYLIRRQKRDKLRQRKSVGFQYLLEPRLLVNTHSTTIMSKQWNLLVLCKLVVSILTFVYVYVVVLNILQLKSLEKKV